MTTTPDTHSGVPEESGEDVDSKGIDTPYPLLTDTDSINQLLDKLRVPDCGHGEVIASFQHQEQEIRTKACDILYAVQGYMLEHGDADLQLYGDVSDFLDGSPDYLTELTSLRDTINRLTQELEEARERLAVWKAGMRKDGFVSRIAELENLLATEKEVSRSAIEVGNSWAERYATLRTQNQQVREALERIRDADFRGNRCPDAAIAAAALNPSPSTPSSDTEGEGK